MEDNNIYTFLPWLRQGISGEINEEDIGITEDVVYDDRIEEVGAATEGEEVPPAATRATFTARVNITAAPIEGEEAHEEEREKEIELFGPGEVIGISQRAIIKTEPRSGVTDFEPNYLPFVEFYDEDFPWRYTPAKPNGENKLRPWLALIVCKEGEFQLEMAAHNELESNEGQQVLLPYIINGEENQIPFPLAHQSWAWAHVHVNKEIAAENEDAEVYDLVHQAPNEAYSRLLCPRRLEENTHYTAFLIPAFEQGRLAGLGASDIDISKAHPQRPAWVGNGESPPSGQYENKWPVYFQWSFKTGRRLDFEYLVRLIEPRILDNKIGKRLIDISNPGLQLNYAGYKNIFLEGALKLRGANSIPDKWLKNTNPDIISFIDQLQTLVNLNTDLVESEAGASFQLEKDLLTNEDLPTEGYYDDPIVTPPLYGQYHALRARAKYEEEGDQKNWFNQLNLDPRNRVLAGAGTAVVQKNQETYMEQAWRQVNKIIQQNRRFQSAILGRELSRLIFLKDIFGLDHGNLFSLTNPLHKFVHLRELDQGLGSVHAVFRHSVNIPQVLTSSVFHRISRPGNAIFKRLRVGGALNIINNRFNFGLDNISGLFPEYGGNIPGGIDLGTLSNGLQELINLEQLAGIGQWGNIFSNALSGGAIGIEIPLPPLGFRSVKPSTRQSPTVSYRGGDSEEASTPREVAVAEVATALRNRINPENSFKRKVGVANPAANIVPAKAYPEFSDAMYKGLRNISKEFILPNIHLIPPNTFSLLETNQGPIDAYMVGLNHEMARELYWREYPTDRRGSYFRQFWEVIDNMDVYSPEGRIWDKFKDIAPIHEWRSNTELGDETHNSEYALWEKAKPVSFVFTTDMGTQVSYFSIIDHEKLNKKPNLKLFVTQIGGTANRNEVGVGYWREKWHIINLNKAAMPDGVQFGVLALDPNEFDNVFTYIPSEENTFLDHSLINYNENAIILLSQSYQSQNSGRFNDSPVGLRYQSDGYWRVISLKTPPQPIEPGTEFNVLVVNEGDLKDLGPLAGGAFIHERHTEENTVSTIDNAYTNDKSEYLLFATNRSHSVGTWGSYPSNYSSTFLRFNNDNHWEIFNLDDSEESKRTRFNVLAFRPDEPSEVNRLVFLVRGELLKRFPNTLIFLQKAVEDPENPGKRTLDKESPPEERIKQPIFQAKVDPDITFLGFDIKPGDAEGNVEEGNLGWFIVIAERPGEARFGFDLPQEDFNADHPIATWNDLTWGHFPDETDYIDIDTMPKRLSPTEPEDSDETNEAEMAIKWKEDAAHMAYITYQLPYLAAIHASEMLPKNP